VEAGQLKLGKVAVMGPAAQLIRFTTPLRMAGINVDTFAGMGPNEQALRAAQYECAVFVLFPLVFVRDNWTRRERTSSVENIVRHVKECLSEPET
jgi:hypothetical protein